MVRLSSLIASGQIVQILFASQEGVSGGDGDAGGAAVAGVDVGTVALDLSVSMLPLLVFCVS